MGNRSRFLPSIFAFFAILDDRSGVLASKSGIFLSRRTLSVEVGRALSKALTRADTPHGVPVVLVAAAGIQATIVVAQAGLVAANVRGSRPPVAVGAGIAERAIVVVPTIDGREGGAVAGVSCDSVELCLSWQFPAFGTDVLGGVLLRSIVTDRSG